MAEYILGAWVPDCWLKPITDVYGLEDMLPFKVYQFVCHSSKSFIPVSRECVAKSSSFPQKESLSSFRSILSDENKCRVQSKITSIEPVRSTKHVPLRDGHLEAAVLVPLCLVNNEPSLLLTLRSDNLKKHRGQVSFPGGLVEECDSDFAATALRETQEELGIHPSVFDVWGQMNPLPTNNGDTIVYPILASMGEVDVSNLRMNKSEVEEVFTVTVEHLCQPYNVGATRFRTGSGYTLPVYTGASHRVWGLTAIMIHQLLHLLAPDFYRFKLRHKRQYIPR